MVNPLRCIKWIAYRTREFNNLCDQSALLLANGRLITLTTSSLYFKVIKTFQSLPLITVGQSSSIFAYCDFIKRQTSLIYMNLLTMRRNMRTAICPYLLKNYSATSFRANIQWTKGNFQEHHQKYGEQKFKIINLCYVPTYFEEQLL